MIATADDGTRLHYVVEGSGPPLVLVGGKTSSIAGAWWRYIPALSGRLKVIAFDNRGSGQSDKPEAPYSIPLMAKDAATVLRAAGETSAHWFGISLGGMILQQLALDQPHAVRSLVLGATHCGGERPSGPVAAVPGLAESPLRRYANLYEPHFILDHAEWVAEDAQHFGKMPLHAIIRQDQMVPVARGEELERGLPNGRLRILDPAGHQFHSEQFATVLPMIVGFVEEVERQRR